MKKLLIYSFFFLNICLVNAQKQTGDTRKDSICITAKELILHPEKYDKKYVAVSGFVSLEKEGKSAIYISESDYINERMENSVTFMYIFERSSYHITTTYHKTYATVVGWYNKGRFSHYDEDLKKNVETSNGLMSSISTIQ